jgi:hypothetical protein
VIEILFVRWNNFELLYLTKNRVVKLTKTSAAATATAMNSASLSDSLAFSNPLVLSPLSVNVPFGFRPGVPAVMKIVNCVSD